jgi:hypothetical protein
MKKLILIAFLALSVAACKKGELGVVTFDVNQNGTFEMPPNDDLLALLEVTTPAVNSTWKGDFQNNNTNADNLREMKLKSASMTINEPAGQTWKFLEKIEVYIKADGLSETKIAYKDNIDPNVGQTLVLNTVDVDLKPYAQKDAFQLTIKTKAREITTQTIKGDFNMVFKVSAQVLD